MNSTKNDSCYAFPALSSDTLYDAIKTMQAAYHEQSITQGLHYPITTLQIWPNSVCTEVMRLTIKSPYFKPHSSCIQYLACYIKSKDILWPSNPAWRW